MAGCGTLDLGRVRVLLCDADGNLFPSEEPAFRASADVTNRFLASVGVRARFSPTELRLATTGKSFRTTATELAAEYGAAADVSPTALERWVAEERREVTAYLAQALSPDPAVLSALEELGRRLTLAAVSSSATRRLAACFTATGLDELFPEAVRFSAEDSLPAPASKPDPAIYHFALEQLGVEPDEALAVEDAAVGVQSAVGAGITTVGNVAFVPPAERPARVAALRDAGAAAVVESWDELRRALVERSAPQPL